MNGWLLPTNKDLTAAIAGREGKRWCGYCFRMKDLDGGIWTIKRHARIFNCAECVAKRKAAKRKKNPEVEVSSGLAKTGREP